MKQNINKTLLLKKLFFSTLYLSAFTFGGGYVIVSLMKTKFVDNLHWIDENEMLDLIAIAQSSPGAVAVNGAIVIGYKLCGVPGVIFSILGAIIPPFFVISIISGFYTLFQENTAVLALLNGMRAGGDRICRMGYGFWNYPSKKSRSNSHYALRLHCKLLSKN